MVYVLYMTSPESLEAAGFVQVFQRAAPAAYLDRLSLEHGLTVRRGIYSLAAVIWLMIFQRLNSKRTLSSAVQWLVLHAASLQPQSNLCKRVLEQRISARTGGYCQARQKLPTLVVTSVTDHLFGQLQAQMREELPDGPRPMFGIDGTTLRLPHERELVSAFPLGHNQHGDNHWPTMLLAEAIVLADGNFGIFAFAYAVCQTQRPLLLRLTAARARKVLGGARLHCGRRRKVGWGASVWERKPHPDLPAGALVEGWVVACRHPARPGEILYFFTTLDLKPRRILALYKLRWNIETDLRSLK